MCTHAGCIHVCTAPSPACHPERGRACTTESKFCGSRMRRPGAPQQAKPRARQTAARSGISKGVSQRLFCPGCISPQSPTAYFQILLCANRRVKNRSQIPLRATGTCAFALLRALRATGTSLRKSSTSGNFAALLRNIPPLRMTHRGRALIPLRRTAYAYKSAGDSQCTMLLLTPKSPLQTGKPVFAIEKADAPWCVCLVVPYSGEINRQCLLFSALA